VKVKVWPTVRLACGPKPPGPPGPPREGPPLKGAQPRPMPCPGGAPAVLVAEEVLELVDVDVWACAEAGRTKAE